MSSSVEFSKTVYDKRSMDKVVDRSFKEFCQTSVQDEKTVEQFFQDYDDLFYQIPVTGSSDSHQYLIERSSLLYQSPESTVNIQPFLDEITLLKSQSVVNQQTIMTLNTRIAELSGTSNNKI